MNTLHSRIKQTRLSLGLSQTDLAQYCGVSQPTVANWERGDHIPRKAALDSIAKHLDVDAFWLLSGEDLSSIDPFTQYLSRPIHHIPVYDWPKSTQHFGQLKPVDFVTVSLDQADAFALISNMTHHQQFGDNATLLFKKCGEIAPDGGQFLVARGESIILTSDFETDDMAIGKLVYSIQKH